MVFKKKVLVKWEIKKEKVDVKKKKEKSLVQNKIFKSSIE